MSPVPAALEKARSSKSPAASVRAGAGCRRQGSWKWRSQLAWIKVFRSGYLAAGKRAAAAAAQEDLYVQIYVRPHRFFKRRNDDILLEVPLNIVQASLGTELEVPTIDGRVKLTIPLALNLEPLSG